MDYLEFTARVTSHIPDKFPSQIAKNYQSEFYGLRPETLLTIHIHKDLWDKFLEKRR